MFVCVHFSAGIYLQFMKTLRGFPEYFAKQAKNGFSYSPIGFAYQPVYKFPRETKFKTLDHSSYDIEDDPN